jgi:enediyne polyketide synthase
MHVRGEARTDPVVPVAIVGVALRFPGSQSPVSFHNLTLSGRRLLRLDYSPDPDPAQDSGLTPWHLLATETAAAALADAGLDGNRPARGRAGTIIASAPALRGGSAAAPAAMSIASRLPAIGAWVRYRLGLAGQRPASACSLRAVAAACEALSDGEFDLMLAGGVSAGTGGSALWDMRVYDASPTGPLPGEGCGMVALMRAADARASGLPVYAEIAGWSAAEDGADLQAVIREAYNRAEVDPADVQLVEGHGAATAADDLAELTALLDVLRQQPAGGPSPGCALGSVCANIGDTGGAAGVAALLKTALAMAAATIPPTTGCVQPHVLLRGENAPFRLPAAPQEWPCRGALVAAVNSLGVPTPASASRSGPTHLVLRREQDAKRPGRRRRTRGQPGTASHGTTTIHQRRHDAMPSDWALTPHLAPPRPRLPQDDQPGPVTAPSPAASSLAASLPAPAAAAVPAPHVLMQRVLARHSAAIRSLLAGSSGAQAPRGLAAGVRPSVQAAAAWPGTVLAISGADRAQLIAELDSVADTAARRPGSSLHELIADPQADPLVAGEPAYSVGPARAAIVVRDPRELAALASSAATLLRGSGTKPLPARPQVPGIHLSEGARGRVTLLFGGLAVTSLEHSAALAGSAATIRAATWLGIEPCAAAGYGFGEIIGLAWAEAISLGEAARLAALRAELLRGAYGSAAMARVHADQESTARLLAGSGLVVAVDEGPRRRVVAGPAPSVRLLPYKAADLGLTAEVLPVPCGLHSPTMRLCVPPMAAVAAATRVVTPRKRLISSVTGQDFRLSGDPAGLLARQLDRPARLASALTLASADADLVLLAVPDTALWETAASCCAVPVIQPPLDVGGHRRLELLAALYTAGAIGSVRRFLPGAPAVRAAKPDARLTLPPPLPYSADRPTLPARTLASTHVLLPRLTSRC